MSLVGFKAKNHRQQIGVRGADDTTDDRATPIEWFAELDARFGFTIDVAASAANTKCERYYDKASDGLKQSWRDERVWCNPPYSDLSAWVAKAWEESGAQLTVLLAPANRTEQAWWQDYVEPYRDQIDSPLRCEFLRHRRRFIRAGATEIKPNERPPFGVCLLIWDWS